MTHRIRAGFYVINFMHPNGIYFAETFRESAEDAEKRTRQTGANHLVLSFVAEVGLKPCPQELEWKGAL